MPELAEVEAYRNLAEAALDRVIGQVEAPDAWYLKGGLDAKGVSDALVGRQFSAARRIGKRLMLDTLANGHSDNPTLGLRFGMTGCVVVDGQAGVADLLYTTKRKNPAYDRFRISFEDGGDMAVRDPRRLGGVELDPDESRLGPDAESIGLFELSRALDGGSTPIKARLLDQSKLAGVGNLMGDEVLWRAGLYPQRLSDSLSFAELRHLHLHLRSTATELIMRGGSHMGDLLPARHPGGLCPDDGAELAMAKIGGRTTWWCPQHQH